MINNNKDIQHSAEGSHWEKKNHKYIRKEGNRYIYPKDLKKLGSSKSSKSPYINPKIKSTYTLNPGSTSQTEVTRVRSGNGYKDKSVSPKGNYMERTTMYVDNNGNYARRTPSDRAYGDNVVQGHKSSLNEKRRNPNPAAIRPSQRQTISNYKKISEQHANEQKAKSHAKASNMSATEAKRISQQRSNRKAAANGVKEIYNFNGEPDFHVWGKSDQENAKRQGEYARRNRKQAKALNKQGSVNRQQEAKDFKEYQDWEKADRKKRDSEPKRKAALNKQGSKSYKYESELYGIRDKDNLSGVRDQVSQQDAKEMSKIHRNTSFQKNLRESNKENNNKMYKLKNRVTKAISNLKKKKTDKVDNSQEEYYNGKATKNTLKNDRDDTYDHLINNAKTKNERKKWQKEKGRLIGTRHYTNDYGVEYDEDVYTNSKAASRGEKRLNYTDRGDGHPINSWDKRGKMVQVAVKSGSDGGGWDVDEVTPENVKAKNYYNRKRKKN